MEVSMDGVMKVFAKRAVNLTLRYLEGDPQENLSKAVNTLMPLAKRDGIKRQLESAKQIIAEKDNPYRNLILRVFNEIAPNVRRRFVTNFVVNASMIGPDRTQMLKYKHDCNIPWAILMDPTSACNLHCKGCWAAEYNKTDSMDYALLDRIIREGKELGVYFYIYSGGEPTIRKNDLIKLAQVHNDCMFLAFTNGTLVDQDFALALAEVGNFALAFSIEGFEEATDFRRGAGTYAKVIEAMQYMKQIGAPFGFSAVYHGQNTEQVGNEAFLDFLIEQGCMFGWYFTYIPLGKDADTALIASPSQREYMFHWVRKCGTRSRYSFSIFWNDGQYVDGCIAGGRRYLHINSAGDVEPCAFNSLFQCQHKECIPACKLSNRHSLSNIKSSSHSIKTTCVPVPCWTILKHFHLC
jgi:MoaA/NifB/PqqE/SkfB family radical SAM enzyme